MITPRPEQEALRIVERITPAPRLLQTAVSAPTPTLVEPVKPDRNGLLGGHRVALLGGIIIAVVIAASVVIYRTGHPSLPIVVHITAPDKGSALRPKKSGESRLIPVTVDMLDVTSIALGNPPLAVVNGRELAEGDSIVVKTRVGSAVLRVIRIEDGMVRFQHDGQTISAKLRPPKKSSG